MLFNFYLQRGTLKYSRLKGLPCQQKQGKPMACATINQLAIKGKLGYIRNIT